MYPQKRQIQLQHIPEMFALNSHAFVNGCYSVMILYLFRFFRVSFLVFHNLFYFLFPLFSSFFTLILYFLTFYFPFPLFPSRFFFPLSLFSFCLYCCLLRGKRKRISVYKWTRLSLKKHKKCAGMLTSLLRSTFMTSSTLPQKRRMSFPFGWLDSKLDSQTHKHNVRAHTRQTHKYTHTPIHLHIFI